MLINLIIIAILWGKHCHYPHFIDVEAEEMGRLSTLPKVTVLLDGRAGIWTLVAGPQAGLFNHSVIFLHSPQFLPTPHISWWPWWLLRKPKQSEKTFHLLLHNIWQHQRLASPFVHRIPSPLANSRTGFQPLNHSLLIITYFSLALSH